MKWCSLPYEEATWELQEDLDPEKIKEFEEVQKLPADCGHMVRRRIIIFTWSNWSDWLNLDSTLFTIYLK